MRNFRELEIWKNGIFIVEKIYEISVKLPIDERFGLKSQITRAAISIPSNIAEGCSRNSEIEFKRFLEIAMGSLFEVETQLTICIRLDFLQETELNDLFQILNSEAKMINSLITKIKTHS
ncbi:four helix bundle protein [Aequorivita echinoideorum]|uniref:Four helix bundle protein n=1 Tax=Aequorivita echinoideorum TaxID=1549647 RepID=A0ABS5S3U8_9FLAO|nr:four helix bundle protein [Aequorivita echinoideorum]MBT0607880.1 four helix bundle protein [Aequorivita echinoideorum]